MDDRFESEMHEMIEDKLAHVIKIVERAGISLEEVQEILAAYLEEDYPQ